MRDWMVAGAVIEDDSGLLLVRNRRFDGTTDWSPPGGVIDPGESVVEGLTREVREETGFLVTEWSPPRYEIHAEAPEMGWRLRVEVCSALAWEGDLRLDDPDGIVEHAEWVPIEHCAQRLEGVAPWVAEPVIEWLAERWAETRRFEYRITGRGRTDLEVVRV